MKNLRIPFWLKVTLGIIVCNAVGLLSATVTINAIPGWYANLNKPFFNPPNWLFGPTWTLLYTLMGISAAAVWEAGLSNPKVKTALQVFGIQLVLNGIWSFLFFGLKVPLFAFFELLFLLVAILFTFKQFKPIKPWAAWLLIPYILWVSFAGILNLSIALLN